MASLPLTATKKWDEIVDEGISRQNEHQVILLSCVNAPQRPSPQLQPFHCGVVGKQSISLYLWVRNCSNINTSGTVNSSTQLTNNKVTLPKQVNELTTAAI